MRPQDFASVVMAWMYVFMAAASAHDEMQIIEHNRMCDENKSAMTTYRYKSDNNYDGKHTHAPRLLLHRCNENKVCALFASSPIDSSALDLIRYSHQFILSIGFERCSKEEHNFRKIFEHTYFHKSKDGNLVSSEFECEFLLFRVYPRNWLKESSIPPNFRCSIYKVKLTL